MIDRSARHRHNTVSLIAICHERSLTVLVIGSTVTSLQVVSNNDRKSGL